MILQTGRDYSINELKNNRPEQNVKSGAKLIKMAVGANPNVKVLLLAPYGYQASFTAFNQVTITNHSEHIVHINKEAENIFAAAVAKAPNVNLEIAYVSDLFEGYENVVADLYRADDGQAAVKFAGLN
jgi:hypothetical protein